MAIPFLSGLEIATGTHNEITFTGTGGAKILAPVEMYLDASNDIYLMSHSSVNLTLGNNIATFSGNLNVTKTDPKITLFDNSGANTGYWDNVVLIFWYSIHIRPIDFCKAPSTNFNYNILHTQLPM